MNYQLKNDLLVVKVGTNVLAETGNGYERLDNQTFELIGSEVRQLSDAGNGIVLVTSGAITAGVFGEQKRREGISCAAEEQRYAARGWDIVVQKWKSVIGNERVSSTLLTKREVHTDSMREKLLGVIACCLSYKDIFVVNENDCLSDDEIKFGDNDTLAAALVAECAISGLSKSVKLILLTNKNGLNQVADDDSTLIRTVTDIDLVEEFAGSATNGHSRGGMKTKVSAARIAKVSGVESYIANGRENNVISRTLLGEIGTHFTV